MKFRGVIAWFLWLFLHVMFLIGFRNRLFVMMGWFWAYLTRERSARLITGDAEELRNALIFMEGEPAGEILDRFSKRAAANAAARKK
jgi:NADH:ubiquinone reductase (H+-translocating)